MKRFWKSAAAVAEDGNWAIQLDGKPLRTPARKPLLVPAQALAQAIADEWNGAGETVDPRDLPLTGLANAAIDRIAPDPAAFAVSLAAYGESDLACYRADGPRELVDRQEASWDRLLGWAKSRFDVDLKTTSGIIHVAQPGASVRRLADAVAALDHFSLAGLSPLVAIGGSLVTALAILEAAISPEAAWEAVTIDDTWQSEQWGMDAEAEAALKVRKHAFLAGARFLNLLAAG